MENELMNPAQEPQATFLIKMEYRQNSTWQGVLTWVEEKKEMCFRSELELLSLMNTALEEKSGGEKAEME